MPDQLEDVDAVAVGHRDIQHQYIEFGVAQPRHDFVAAAGFASHLDVGLFGNELSQPGTHNLVIVSDQNADHVGLHWVERTGTLPGAVGVQAEPHALLSL
ncbi:hypothetical protein D3C72_1779030 [compost metagenome]